MRRHPRSLLVGATVMIFLAAVALAAAAPNVQIIGGDVTPHKLPADRRAPVTLLTDVQLSNPDNPNQLPNPTTLLKIDYDDAGAFYQRGLRTCNPNSFTAGTTSEEAKKICRGALVGGGTSRAAVPLAGSPFFIDAKVLIFNGKRKTLVMHTYNDLSGELTLIGRVRRADPGPPPAGAGPGYGLTMTVRIPPLSAGATITRFTTSVHRVWRFKHRRRSLVSAKCGADRELGSQVRTTDNAGQVVVGSVAQPCEVRQPPRRARG
jgi:hypothetical protein